MKKPVQKYCWLFALTLFILIPLPTTADTPPLSFEEYWQKVEQTQGWVESVSDDLTEEDRAQFISLADEWENITQVKLADGTIIPVDHTFLAAQLRADSPNVSRLNGLLTILLSARSNWPKAQHSAFDIESLNQILARSEFQWIPEQPSPLAVLWQKVLGFLWKQLSALMPEEAIIPLNSSWFQYIVTGLATLILVLVLFYILRGLIADLVSDTELNVDPETGQEVLTADSAFQRAQNLSGAGDYRTAVRYLYLSSLLLLDERGLLRYNRWQTNREYLRSVAHLPHLAAILKDVIEVFDRVWYGYQPLDKNTYAQYAARVTELRHQR